MEHDMKYVIPKSSKFQKKYGLNFDVNKEYLYIFREILATFYILEITASLIVSQWLTKLEILLNFQSVKYW